MAAPRWGPGGINTVQRVVAVVEALPECSLVMVCPPPPPPRSSEARRSASPGDESDEFHGLRNWREGDPIHRIAWKASQRHDQLLARQFMRPERGRVVFRLDQAPAADLEGRLSILCRWILDAERDGVEYGLELGTWRTAPDRGEAHRNRCLDALADHA